MRIHFSPKHEPKQSKKRSQKTVCQNEILFYNVLGSLLLCFCVPLATHCIVEYKYAQIRIISTAVTEVLMVSGSQNTSGCVDGTTSHGNAKPLSHFIHVPSSDAKSGRKRQKLEYTRTLCFVASTTSRKSLKKNRTLRVRKRRTNREK